LAFRLNPGRWVFMHTLPRPAQSMDGYGLSSSVALVPARHDCARGQSNSLQGAVSISTGKRTRANHTMLGAKDTKRLKIMCIVGARPNLMKIAPLMAELRQHDD